MDSSLGNYCNTCLPGERSRLGSFVFRPVFAFLFLRHFIASQAINEINQSSLPFVDERLAVGI